MSCRLQTICFRFLFIFLLTWEVFTANELATEKRNNENRIGVECKPDIAVYSEKND